MSDGRCGAHGSFQHNRPFYPRVTYVIIERDVTAGVHSCAILGYLTITTYGHSQYIRVHAATALYRVTYFSENTWNIELSCFSMVQVPSSSDLPFASKRFTFISTKGESSGKGHKLMLYFTYTRVWADAGSGLIPSSYPMLVSNIPEISQLRING